MKKPTQYTLYTITCLPNGKTYVGVCLWWAQRKGKHLYDLRNRGHANHYLQEDYLKYGETAFVFDVIQMYDSEMEALRIEKYYTNCIFGMNKDVCYNIINGGGNVAAQIQKIHQHKLKTDPEHRRMVSENSSRAQTGKILSNETKNKIRAAHVGRKASQQTRDKFSEMRKGGSNPKAKKVIDSNTEKIYNCLKDAAKDLGINYDVLRSRVNGYNNVKTSVKWL